MKEGIMYVYTVPKASLEKKIKTAAQQYYLKLGQVPNRVHVNEGQLDGQDVQVEGLRVVGAKNVPRHHFWMGVDGS